MKPSVGRMVHYISHGTPRRADGSQAYTSECRAAVITEVDGPVVDPKTGQQEDAWTVGLCVLNPTGQFFNQHVVQHDGGETPGDPSCRIKEVHGNPFRYCQCGWSEAAYVGGTWHWPERVEGST